MDAAGTKRLLEAMKANRLSYLLLEIQAEGAKGDSAAMVALSSAYLSGKHGLQKDYVEAKHWLEKIDPGEDPIGYAPHYLGMIYYKGLGVHVDRRKAFVHFRRAALLGNRRSKWVVATMLSQGNGTSRKPVAAKTINRHCAKDRSTNPFMRLYLWFLSFTG
jgi:TPR repeat protein